MGVEEELEALRNQGVTKKNASKLKDANGLSTPEAEESAIKAEHERTRTANYGKEAGDNLKAYNEAKVALQGDCEGIFSPKASQSPRKTTNPSEETLRETKSLKPAANPTEEPTTPVPVSSSSNDSSIPSPPQREETSMKRPTHQISPPPPPSSSPQPEDRGSALPTPAGEPTREEQETKLTFELQFKRFLLDSLNSKAVLSTIAVTVLLSFSIGMTVGILPEVLTDRYARLYHGYGYGRPCWEYDSSNMPKACALGSDDAQTGSAYGMLFQNLLTFFFNAILGSYSDTHGRRPLLLLTIFLNALVPAAVVAIQVIETMDPFWYYATNSATGFISFPSMVFATMSDDCPEEHRAGRFAVSMAAFYFGFAIAPMLPMCMSHIVVSWLAFALAAVMVVFSLLFLPETLPSLVVENNNNNNSHRPSRAISGDSAISLSQVEAGEDHDDPSLERESSIHGTANNNVIELPLTSSRCRQATQNLIFRPFLEMAILNRCRVLRLLAIGSFLSAAVYSIDNSLVLFYIEEYLNVREADIGIMFFLMGIAGAVLQGSLQPLVYLLNEQGLLVIAFFSGAAHNFLYGVASTKTEITVALSLSQLTKLSYPLLSSLASQQVGVDEQGRVQGALLGLNALAGALGPVSMNWVYARTKDGTHKPFGPGTMFLLSSALYFLGAIVVSRIPSSQSDTDGSNGNSDITSTNCTSAENTGGESIPWEGEDLEEPLLLRLGETTTI